ncbi:peptide/nickel transport system ATP-binding protein [Arboricoccus pini]|uniref:Peptide/nickel transport system ATP-binding protein n=1 Tax=Arboricoccus pini TaxID=1963835 RepID=A0A212REZ0_9PROT|nr:ABC transporter ATP-binding protein [Arboricoccus pini]SNB70837.1 peptide/nickel transport system ATP-binding protein [Arboricoccus pini]
MSETILQTSVVAAAEPVAPVLTVQDLRVEFRHGGRWTPVVRGVSFDIRPAETLAVVGESGSGKSVTALSIMRLLPKRTARIGGRVELAGRNLLDLPEPALPSVRGREVGMIFQEPMTSLNPVMPIGQQIGETLRIHQKMSARAADAEVVRLLDRVRIPDARRRRLDYPHRLSGGMRQRAMIAAAIACRPKLLIADEPTTALDVTIQAQILDLLRDLQDEMGVALLFITHDMGVVAQLADRVMVMRHGQIVEQGQAASLLAAPSQAYTKALLAAVPRLGDMAGSTTPRRFADGAQPAQGGEAPAQGRPLLTVEDLVTRFPARRNWRGRRTAEVVAVDHVSFDLHEGETLAIVGESGSGKSTTGRSILRLIEPYSGSVRFAGQTLAGLDEVALRPFRQRMQMIFQDPFGSLDPRQTIGSALAEPIRLHGLARGRQIRERTAELLVRVGLDAAHLDRYPHQFSGGQRQRICIARALALEPRLLIADEAVSALDVSVKARIVDLLIDLQQQLGIACLFISHDMAVVERISHRIAVMYRGQIVEIGSRAQIMETPQHPYTRHLLNAVPSLTRAAPLPRGAAGFMPDFPFRPGPRPRLEVAPGHFVQASD